MTSTAALSEFPSLTEFCSKFSKYPSIHLFHLVRDLVLKADSQGDGERLKILDGSNDLLIDDYYVVSESDSGEKTLYISLSFEDEIDLEWMHRMCEKAQHDNYTLMLCAHSPDGIV